ncbi:MFS transporter [Elstera litoralis]|uniref:MFS transporter n=1 Tax=Elstera litoralis TaxID=552518 RepID=UPI000698D5E9|nr:MFS transporter [Elstera litoralis]
MQPTAKNLSGTDLAAYAAPALPLAALAVPLYIYLPTLYAETLGLGLTLVGTLLLLARIFDALTDPLVGVLADRFPRRKPWLLGALPVIGVSVWALFFPPDGTGAMHLLGWSLALYLGWTALQVPYLAWGTDLTQAYHGRTRVAGAREAALLIGTLAATILPAALGLSGLAAVNALGGMILALLVPTVLLACWRLPEKSTPPAPKPSRKEAIRLLVANKPSACCWPPICSTGSPTVCPRRCF